jgi:hypothetical protein
MAAGSRVLRESLMHIRAVALMVLLFASPVHAHASEPITPAQAVATAIEDDGSEVVVEGEAIGEALRAPGGMRWVNVLGDGTALGVVMTAEDAAAIPAFGAYRQRGAALRIEGRLNSACDEHGGDLDLHAERVTVLDDGAEIPHRIHPAKLLLAGASLLATMLLIALYRLHRSRSFVA